MSVIFPKVTLVYFLWLSDSGRDRNVENKGVGEADRRDLLEKAKQNAVECLQVGFSCVEEIIVLIYFLNPFVL